MLRLSLNRSVQLQLLKSQRWMSTPVATMKTNESFVDAEKSSSEPPAKSKRQLFREINPDIKVLNHLDSIRLGFLARRKSRVAVARKIDNNAIDMQDMKVGDSYSKHTPFPFKAKGKLLHHANTSEFIAHKFEGDPPEVGIIGRSNVGKSTLLNALVGFDTSFVQKSAMSDKPGETKQLAFYQIGSIHPKYDELETPMFKPNGFAQLGAGGGQSKSQQLGSGPENNSSLATLGGIKTNSLAKSNGSVGIYKPPVIHQQKPKTPALVLVDMPGYGFSYSKQEDKDRMLTLSVDYLMSNMRNAGVSEGSLKDDSDFGDLEGATSTTVSEKFSKKPLKRVLLLLDARHGMKVADINFFNSLYDTIVKEFAYVKEEVLSADEVAKLKKKKNYINTNTPNTTNITMTDEMIESLRMERFHKRLAKMMHWKLQIVLTKCDLLERTDLCRRIMQLRNSVESQLSPIFHNNLPIVVLSGKQKRGLYDLQHELSVLVPDEAANRLSEREKRWQIIRVEREKEALKRLKQERKEKLLAAKKEKQKAKRLAALTAKREKTQQEEEMAALAAAVAKQRETLHIPDSGGLFRDRSSGGNNSTTHEQDESEKVPRGPKPGSRTAHLTEAEYHFRVHHERPLYPTPVDKQLLNFGVDPSEQEMESVLVSDKEFQKSVNANVAAGKSVATMESDLNSVDGDVDDVIGGSDHGDYGDGVDERYSEEELKPEFRKASSVSVASPTITTTATTTATTIATGSKAKSAGESKRHPVKSAVGKAATTAAVAATTAETKSKTGTKPTTAATSTKASVAAATAGSASEGTSSTAGISTSRGRRVRRPVATRVNGVTTFAEVVEEYGPVVGAVGARTIINSNRDTTKKAAATATDAERKREKVVDAIAEAMTRKTEERKENEKKTKREQKQKKQLQQADDVDDKSKSKSEKAPSAKKTSKAAAAVAVKKTPAVSVEDEYYAAMEAREAAMFGRSSARGNTSSSSRISRSAEDDDELEHDEGEYGREEQEQEEEADVFDQEEFARVVTSSQNSSSTVNATKTNGGTAVPSRVATTSATATATTAVSASGTMTSNKKARYDVTRRSNSLANSTPYSDEELYRHASTEEFITSAYDDSVVVGGEVTRAIRDPVTGNIVKPLKLNRKQKRAKRRAKEEAIKSGTLYE